MLETGYDALVILKKKKKKKKKKNTEDWSRLVYRLQVDWYEPVLIGPVQVYIFAKSLDQSQSQLTLN